MYAIYAMSIFSWSHVIFAFSPIKGPEGNIEYLLHLKKSSGRYRGYRQSEGICRSCCGRGSWTVGLKWLSQEESYGQVLYYYKQ